MAYWDIASFENWKIWNLEIINLEIEGNIQAWEEKYPPWCILMVGPLLFSDLVIDWNILS